MMHLPANPRPWSIELGDIEGLVKDASGIEVVSFDAIEDAEFWFELVEIVNEHDRDRHPEVSMPGMSP